MKRPNEILGRAGSAWECHFSPCGNFQSRFSTSATMELGSPKMAGSPSMYDCSTAPSAPHAEYTLETKWIYTRKHNSYFYFFILNWRTSFVFLMYIVMYMCVSGFGREYCIGYQLRAVNVRLAYSNVNGNSCTLVILICDVHICICQQEKNRCQN